MTKKTIPGRNSRTGRFTVGRKAMERISAVEGIRLSLASRAMFAEFDNLGTDVEQRRRAIVKKHAKKG
jgi:hypothetical protein